MKWRMEVLRFVATFSMGAACALWVVPIIAGPSVQRLRLDRDRLVAEADSLRTEVKKLKVANRSQRDSAKVVRVRVEVGGPDDRTGLEAERQVQKSLINDLVGRSVDAVEPMLLYARLQGILLKIDGVQYRLEVKVVSVSTTLTVYGLIQPLQ